MNAYLFLTTIAYNYMQIWIKGIAICLAISSKRAGTYAFYFWRLEYVDLELSTIEVTDHYTMGSN